MSTRDAFLTRCRWPMKVLARLETVHQSIQFLHGPEDIPCARDEFVVLCVLRNGGLWLKSFLEHYERLGARHFVFLDNGSSDTTIPALKLARNTTVLHSTLPYSERFLDFTRYLSLRFGQGRWTLTADVDEFFDYPGSEHRMFGEMLQYLRRYEFNAVRTHLIDMFSDQPLSALDSAPEDSLRAKYPFCDLSDLWGIPDPHSHENVGEGRQLPYLIGGIRKTVFGTNWLYLTKHPLLFDSPSLEIQDPHAVTRASIADFNGMFWHYKFLDSFVANATDIIRRWQGIGDVPGMRYYYQELQAYIQVAGASPSLSLRLPTSVRPQAASQLAMAGVLKASRRYQNFISGRSLITDQPQL